jgi:hypothetical protein
MSERDTLVRGVLTTFELAKQHKGAAVVANLPLGWRLEARCHDSGMSVYDEPDALLSPTTGVARGLTFSLRVEDGIVLSTWPALRRKLQETLAQLSDPSTQGNEEGARRRGSRKRLRPLEFWANERVVYDRGEIVGAIVHDS